MMTIFVSVDYRQLTVGDDSLSVGGVSIEPLLAVTVGAFITGGLYYGMDSPS
jgi:hypothetical protein